MPAPWSEYPQPYGSFAEPLPLITTDPDDDTDRVVVCFPRDYLQVVIGCLSQLQIQATWIATKEEFLDMQMRVTRLQEIFNESTCDMFCCPLFQTDPNTGLPLVSYDGGMTYEPFAPGAYDPDATAPYAAPPPPLNQGSTDADRCLAAANAAQVVATFYQQTVGQVTADLFNAVLNVNIFLSNLNRALLRIVYPEVAMLQQAQGLYEFDWATYATAPTLSDDQISELQCLLYDNASETGGIVSFDFGAVSDGVVAALGSNPGVAVALLLAYMQTPGLNAAGGVNSAVDPDCSECDPVWCYEWDADNDPAWEFFPDGSFPGGQRGSFSSGQWLGADGTNPTARSTEVMMRILFPAIATITAVDVVWTKTNGTWTGSATNQFVVDSSNGWYDGSVIESHDAQTAVDGTFSWTGSQSVSSELTIWMFAALFAPVGSYGSLAIQSIKIQGTGDNPFGDDNC